MALIVRIEDIVKHFSKRGGRGPHGSTIVRAVNGVSLDIHEGETVGLVGESGCGKSTLGRIILKLLPADFGTIFFDGQDITDFSQRQMTAIRRHMQIVFQDPYASLSPRLSVRDILSEPFAIHRLYKKERQQRVADILERVGLCVSDMDKYPHEFSGGQRQRLCIARAIALNPKFIVADESVSALDVSVQAGIINLLKHLQSTLGLSYLFIAHDIKVVSQMSSRIAVMYLGEIVEELPADSLMEAAHPYTRLLIQSVPQIGRPITAREESGLEEKLITEKGCPFRFRCPYRQPLCDNEKPPLTFVKSRHRVSCHFHDTIRREPL